MSILHPGIMERLGAAGRPSKKTKANRRGEAHRIELLGQMWERRKAALGARDKAGLMVLSSEYASLKCPNTAQQVMAEAMSL
jgi:hypothetical protein